MTTRCLWIVLLGLLMACEPTGKKENDEKVTGTEEVPDNAVHRPDETVVKIIEYAVGDWQLKSVFQNDKDISLQEKSGVGQMLTITPDAKYVRKEGDQPVDNGKVRVNEQNSILYLESEAGQKPTEWNITVDQNTMTLTLRGSSAHGSNYRYEYQRTSELSEAAERD